MPNNNQRRKKDSARLTWSSKPRRAPNPKDIDFQTAEMVITKMNRLIWGDNMLAMQALLASGYEGKAMFYGNRSERYGMTKNGFKGSKN